MIRNRPNFDLGAASGELSAPKQGCWFADCVPHFEKMIYDNSQLARVCLHAWQVTGNEFFRTITEEILDYVVQEMTDPGGGFDSTQDADSEGVEGKFFVWTPDEIRRALGDEADDFMAAHDVTPGGNFEGKSILAFVGDMDQRPSLAEDWRKLYQVREKRVHPGLDDKVLTSWNGLMLAAFSEAARALDRDDYRQIAEHNADFLLHELRLDNGRLLHSWKDGDARFNGYLEDYAYLIEGLLELYQTPFDARWFVAAHELAETMLTHFSASERRRAAGLAGFFDTSDDHEALITRPRDLQDNATPSGNAVAATVLLKLAGLTNDLHYVDQAHRALAQMQPMMTQYPLGFGQWLQALSKPKEVAIVGDPIDSGTQALLNVVRDGYQPFQVVPLGAPSPEGAQVPLLRDRGLVDGHAAAYVCSGHVCLAPATEMVGLRAQLDLR